MEAPHPFDAWTWVRPHRPAWVVSIARYIMRLCCRASQIVLNATRGPSSTIAACETARNNKRRAVAETAVDRTRARAGVVAGELPFPFIIEQIPANATRRGGRREGDAADSTPCSSPVDLDRSTGGRGSHCAPAIIASSDRREPSSPAQLWHNPACRGRRIVFKNLFSSAIFHLSGVRTSILPRRRRGQNSRPRPRQCRSGKRRRPQVNFLPAQGFLADGAGFHLAHNLLYAEVRLLLADRRLGAPSALAPLGDVRPILFGRSKAFDERHAFMPETTPKRIVARRQPRSASSSRRARSVKSGFSAIRASSQSPSIQSNQILLQG